MRQIKQTNMSYPITNIDTENLLPDDVIDDEKIEEILEEEGEEPVEE